MEQEGNDENLEEINQLKSSLTSEDELITVMVSNINVDMINALENLDVVRDVSHIGEGRLNINLKRSEKSVNDVVTAILKNDGNIASIKTNDPTLEDVFVAITAKKRKGIK